MIMVLVRWLMSALVLLIIAEVVPGISISGWYAAIIAALVLGLLNALVKPVLVLLTFPITIVTLGLSVLVINGLLFWFASSFLDGFDVTGFWSAFLGALIMTVFSSVISLSTKSK